MKNNELPNNQNFPCFLFFISYMATLVKISSKMKCALLVCFIFSLLLLVTSIELNSNECVYLYRFVIKDDVDALAHILRRFNCQKEKSLNLVGCSIEGVNPFLYAVRRTSFPVVQMLANVCDEATINSMDDDGDNAIQTVALRKPQDKEETKDMLAILDLLLVEKVDPNNKSKKGVTALITGCHFGNKDFVELLLPHVKPNILNHRMGSEEIGKTSLMFAVSKNHFEIVKLLLQQEGINVYLKRNADSYLLDFAVSSGCNEDVMNALIGYFQTLEINDEFKKCIWKAMTAALLTGNDIAAIKLQEMLDSRNLVYRPERFLKIDEFKVQFPKNSNKF